MRGGDEGLFNQIEDDSFSLKGLGGRVRSRSGGGVVDRYKGKVCCVNEDCRISKPDKLQGSSSGVSSSDSETWGVDSRNCQGD